MTGRARRLRMRGFQARPSVLRLLRALEQNAHPPLARYQRAMAARTR